ncbi:unnamed protein product [Schistosoma turkestanicum]|nr:unnamed protein product [Schistosoma turkestanicum]
MVAEEDADLVNPVDSEKNAVQNHGYSLRKGDFAQRPMSIKKFLEPFDHSSLTNNEAGEKYAAYKASFVRQQLEEFFERNKAYAWFREKYHPDYCTDSSSSMKFFERRLEIFMEFYKSGYFDNLHLTSGYENEIVRLLDMVAIKLAGGTEEDFILLDKLLEERISENSNMVVEQSTFEHTENPKPNNNIIQSSEIREDLLDKAKSDASIMKKAKTKTDYHDSSSAQKRKVSKMKRQQNNADDEQEEGEDSSLSEDDESNGGSRSDSVNSHSGDSSSSDDNNNNNSTSGSSSSSSDSSDDDGHGSSHSSSSSSSSSSNSSSTDDDNNNNNDNKKHLKKVIKSKSSSSDSSDGETTVKHKKKHSKLVKDKNVSEASGHSGDRRRHRRRHHDDDKSIDENTHTKVNNSNSTSHSDNNDHRDHQNESANANVIPNEANMLSPMISSNTTESNQSNTVYVLSGLTNPPYATDGVSVNDDTNNDQSITYVGEKPLDLDNVMIEKSTDPINEDQLNEVIITDKQTRRPIHYTSLLFFPHIPFNILKRDLISVSFSVVVVFV